MELIGRFLAWGALAAVLLPVLYFTLITLAALIPQRARVSAVRQRRFAVVIPAHDEQLLIAETVSAALKQSYPADSYAVIVIADNCSDNTAELARAAGARVIERSQNPGKGQALFEAFEGLGSEGWDGYLVVDADSLLHPNALDTINAEFEDGAEVIQLHYAIRNPDENMRTRVMELAMSSFNGLRPYGKTRLGLSAGICGNGFCVSADTLKRVPYLAHSIVEDLEYHVHLLKSGIAVRFTDRACVDAIMPISKEAAETQRVRWERGKLITIKSYAATLLRRGLRGDLRALDGLLDICTPPATLLVIPLLLAALLGGSPERVLAALMFALLVFHYLVATWRYGNFRRMAQVAGYVPWYICWKLFVVLSSLVKNKRLGWQRTERDSGD
ncbi:glycosyltransferase family 2 protein [Marinobacterium jannaschii]|uniref:glycosyltransferase family 2 protein n=1 Tax=Marinobacterium jannaschii TaxID=64970 RepID=UPI000486B83D|nr:glycosyltransferase family 2 protein [Marinobacterium jannaschii]